MKSKEPLNRIFLIQYLINKHDFRSYLEIGTQKGKSFLPIVCPTKAAVDPNFQIPWKEKIKWFFRYPNNLRNKYFQGTSDEFFKNYSSLLKDQILDIVLIDGLHTFKTTLKDSLNALKYLNKEGIIVLHDCFPPHEASAIAAKDAEEAARIGSKTKGWTGEWCGDSWKAIVYLRKKYCNDLDVFVLDADYGLGIIKYKNTNNIDLGVDEGLCKYINSLNYQDLKKDATELLGLVSPSFYRNL